MQLQHIEFDKLSVSPLNMRHGTDPDVSDILPTVRARGILVPLIVRPGSAPDAFEIVAGSRRFKAGRIVRDEGGEIDPPPCVVMGEGDDAAAIEASLIENIARLDPDEMSQHETFARLIREGKTADEIANTFGITTRMVERRLALGNLLPRIRDLYRAEEIDARTVQHLTLATEKQQKAWLKLYAKKQAPTAWQVKQWLFGGNSIETSVALFALEEYTGRIVADLFGEERYFAELDQFWELQNRAIADKRMELIEQSWVAVEILEPGQQFREWEHERRPKSKDGRVFISVARNGEVAIHEGWISRKEARRAHRAAERAKAGEPVTADRPETTKALANYIDLHRHALARLAILDAAPGVVLRLAVAQIIAGSRLWSVKADDQAVRSEAIADSIKTSRADQQFAEKRRSVLALLGLPDYHRTVVRAHGDATESGELFAALCRFPDGIVLSLLAFVIAESLEAGSALVEAVGVHQGIEAREHWTPDDTFFELIRDREVANGMLSDVAGKVVAEAHLADKLKIQKKIIRDCLAGESGRAKVENWLPRYLEFPCRAYTDRGGVSAVTAWAQLAGAFEAAPAAA